MDMKIVVIPGLTLPTVSESDLRRIKEAGNTENVVVTTYEGAHNEVADADVVLGFINSRLFEVCGRLQWVQSISSGIDSFLFPAFQNSDVILTSEKGLVGEHLADHAFGLLLMLTRQLKTALLHGPDAWNHRPEMRYQETELSGSTIGIYGFGGTGRAVAQRAHAFGMQIEAMDIEDVTTTPEVPEVRGLDYWDKLLQTSDVLAVCCPLTNITRDSLDRNAFAKMKPSAYLINVTRGEVMVENDLVGALQNGQIRGAGLDVVPREPLPAESDLWGLPNVVMSPHTAGASQFRAERNLERFLRNLRRFVQDGVNAEFEGLIDKLKGY